MNKKRLYDNSLAAMYKDGQPYRPSNGTEGMMFEELYCNQCALEDYDHETGTGGCDILTRALAFDMDDPEYPKEWIHGPDGQPKCAAFRETLDATQKELEEAGQGRLPGV